MKAGTTYGRALSASSPAPGCAGNRSYGSGPLLRVPSGWKPTRLPLARSLSTRMPRLCALNARFEGARKNGGNIEPPERSRQMRRPSGFS